MEMFSGSIGAWLWHCMINTYISSTATASYSWYHYHM